MIIFGWEKTIKPVETVLKNQCYHCKNYSSWTVIKETEWVSLYFIKVLPFINKYHIGCDICGDCVTLDAKLAKDVLTPNKRNNALHSALVAKIEAHQFSGLTQVQIEYRKTQMGQKFNL